MQHHVQTSIAGLFLGLTAAAMSTNTLAHEPNAESPLPARAIDLPELPYDKSQLPKIGELDTMIVAAETLEASQAQVVSQFQALKLASSVSLNGTVAEQVKIAMGVVDQLEAFRTEAQPMAAAARKQFMHAYASDDEFSQRYRETYSEAEESLDSIIGDHATRRAVLSAMSHTYRNTPRTNLSYLESMLEEAQALREKAITQVIRSAETDLMVADFKKGTALVDLLQGTRGKLAVVQPLDPKNAAIAEMLTTIAEKQASRSAEVATAREAYRFPARFDATNAPKNFAELEKSMKEALERRGYEVKAIAIASPWVAIRSALGVHMYNQIDFHVAVESSIEVEAKANILDVLYVTGKTGGTKLEVPFSRDALGCIGQMMAKNL